MKLANIVLTEEQIILEEILTEGIFDIISSGLTATRRYFNNLKSGNNVRSELKSLNGVKSPDNDVIKAACIELRKELMTLYSTSSPATKNSFDIMMKKIGATPISGLYVSRNYYSDFIKYSTAKPIFDVNSANISEKATAFVADKFVGIAISVLTGIPNIDDIKDVADLTIKGIKVSNDVANKWNSLKAQNVGSAAT